jgi:hypothetical protein
VTRIVWDKPGSRTYETGVDRGVLFPFGEKGVAWNGLTTVTESPSGAEASPQYSDNVKYLNLLSNEEFGGTIEAFSSPKEFAKCDGSGSPFAGLSIGQQPRRQFHLSYRTKLGNDTEGADYGYKLHLVYNALASPAERAYGTVSDSPEALTLSWEFSTTPMFTSATTNPTSHLVVDSTKVTPSLLLAIEDALYGTYGDPRILTPSDIFELGEGLPDSPPAFLKIVPNFTTGIAEIVDGGIDLDNGTTDGVYIAPENSRLTPSAKPGRYILKED